MKRSVLFLLAMGCAMMMPSLAMAQPQGQRGNFDPAQFRERMLNRVKEQLGATDDEWKVLQPKIEKVMEAQRAGFGGGRFFRGRRGGDGGAENQNLPPAAKAAEDLRKTLENKDASADEIKTKLAALRDARAKAHAELEAARKELKDVLTQRQEAVLVTSGMLE